MTVSKLAHLVNEQVQVSIATSLSRATDRIADRMAAEILKDPAFKAKMETLVRAAFERALKDLAVPINEE